MVGRYSIKPTLTFFIYLPLVTRPYTDLARALLLMDYAKK